MESQTMKEQDAPQPVPFDRFKDLTRRLVSVPKKEVDKKEAAWQKKRAAKKRRAAGK